VAVARWLGVAEKEAVFVSVVAAGKAERAPYAMKQIYVAGAGPRTSFQRPAVAFVQFSRNLVFVSSGAAAVRHHAGK
jgi:hypothetical protein